MRNFLTQTVPLSLVLFIASACNPLDDPGTASADDGSGHRGSRKVIGDSCKTSDEGRICLGLKYVVYEDDNGTPTATQQDAIDNIKKVNEVYARCNIGIQIEEFIHVDPTEHKLAYRTVNKADLDSIRRVFVEPDMLLLVTTGTWMRTGTLGANKANAWTAMPGGGPYGVIMEKPVATYPNIIAHELGHYLNLLHINDQHDLMNPVIYSNSTKLNDTQCATMRAAASTYWSRQNR